MIIVPDLNRLRTQIDGLATMTRPNKQRSQGGDDEGGGEDGVDYRVIMCGGQIRNFRQQSQIF